MLDKIGLINSLKQLNHKCENDPMSPDTFAEKMADLIESYVKSGTVKILTGQSIPVTPGMLTDSSTAVPVIGNIQTTKELEGRIE